MSGDQTVNHTHIQEHEKNFRVRSICTIQNRSTRNSVVRFVRSGSGAVRAYSCCSDPWTSSSRSSFNFERVVHSIIDFLRAFSTLVLFLSQVVFPTWCFPLIFDIRATSITLIKRTRASLFDLCMPAPHALHDLHAPCETRLYKSNAPLVNG